MSSIVFAYDALDCSDVQGPTPDEIMVGVEARLRVMQEARVLFHDSSFPVVELANSLHAWCTDAPAQRDFRFDSMSYEQIGVVSLTKSDRGWTFSSINNPESISEPMEWPEIVISVARFVDQVRLEIERCGLDSAWIST